LYYELGKMGARSVGQKKKWPYRYSQLEGLFTLAAEWSRFDPRLLEVLVQYALDHWKDLNPQRLRALTKKMETPQTMGVIATFVQTANPQDTELILFWNYITEGLKPVESQYYFRDLYLPGSGLAQRAARESLYEFKKWGFLGRERLIIDPTTKKTIGTWDQVARLNILKRLLGNQKKLQISDYLEALKHSISRQQALLDLKASGARQTKGGRSSYWTS